MFIFPQMNWRIIGLALSVVIFLVFSFVQHATSAVKKLHAGQESPAFEAAARQDRRGMNGPQRKDFQRRTGSSQQSSIKTTPSSFSHATRGHYENCVACHIMQTKTQFTFDKPDISDYPQHAACIGCHRQQFSRARLSSRAPTFCAGCHTDIGIRTGARHLFPKPKQPSQFAGLFSHLSHIKTTSLQTFMKGTGKARNLQGTCVYCHKVDETKYEAPVYASSALYVPPVGTFMLSPTTHDSCFKCHWQKGVENRDQPPLATECVGCHRNLVRPIESPELTTPTILANSALARRPNVPTATPIMIAEIDQPFRRRHADLTFSHAMYGHETQTNDEGREIPITCTRCHSSVRRSLSIEDLTMNEFNRVQLLPSCSSSACHTALAGSIGLKLSVFHELRERGKDAKFECALCHTPPVSLNAEIPCSHYTAVLSSAKKENESLERVGKKPRSLTRIEMLIPPRCVETIKAERVPPPTCEPAH